MILFINKKRVAFLVCLVILVLVLVDTRWFYHFFYPLQYKEQITKYAEEYNVDPYLIAAVIKTESKFSPKAKSPQGAMGVMQIMPETGAWASKQLNIKKFDPKMLYDPETNIRIGTWYIARLKHEFGEDMILALASYNGGGGNVKQWLAKDQWSGEHATIEQIPFPETRNYVKRVIDNYKKYRWVYEK